MYLLDPLVIFYQYVHQYKHHPLFFFQFLQEIYAYTFSILFSIHRLEFFKHLDIYLPSGFSSETKFYNQFYFESCGQEDLILIETHFFNQSTLLYIR
jgi:hypothetical protein